MDRRRTAGFHVLTGVVLGGLLWAAGPAQAGKVVLKNGTEIAGALVEIKGFDERSTRRQAGELETTPFRLIDDGYRRYLVSYRQVATVDPGRDLVAYDFFDLPKKKSRTGLGIASVGLPKRVDDFDEHGVRTVTLETPRGEASVVQGVTRIGPEYLTVEGISHEWRLGIATKVVPPERLSAMIHGAIDRADPEDRMSVVRFYIKAGLYEPAAAELESIRRDFPFLAAKAEEYHRELLQVRARLLLSELRARQAAGQHRLALAAAEAFPTELGFETEVLRQVDELRRRYAAERERGDLAVLLMGELEARLDDPERKAAVAAMRPVLREQLDWDGLGRLEAFLKFAEDESLSPAERLALAYSGWAVGSAKATTDLNQAIGLWRVRNSVRDYLRSTDSARKDELIEELAGIEGVGVGSVADVVRLLPGWLESPDVAPGHVELLETVEPVRGWGDRPDAARPATDRAAGPVRYAVVLPPEYTPTRNYPAIVALRPAEWSIERTAAFWGVGRNAAGKTDVGPATRAGYVVLVPEYAGPKQSEYGGTVREHEAVLAAIRDARKRFTIDSDRVFLTGHGMGGDATFDVAMAHPDVFAGAVPISGLSGPFAKHYRHNAKLVPFYVVNGELDRGARSVSGGDLSQMMLKGQDVLFCEYLGRGYEYYADELPNVFAWMARLRRAADPKSVEANVLRACDDRYYWVKAEGIPLSALTGSVASPTARAPVKPMTLEAKISDGNVINVRSAAARHVLRLNGGLVDFDKRVQVRVGGRRVFNDFVAPDVRSLLEDLAENGDRQRLYPVRLVLQ